MIINCELFRLKHSVLHVQTKCGKNVLKLCFKFKVYDLSYGFVDMNMRI
jgi:hypothetical protein